MKNRKYSKVAVNTAAYFFIFGFFWILLSDNILHYIVNNPQLEIKYQTYKGWFFILLTAVIIYYIVKQQVKTIEDLNNKLQASERNLSAILENIGEGIIQTNSDYIIIEMNSVAEKLTGFSEAEALGKPLGQIFNTIIEEENTSNHVLLPNNIKTKKGKARKLISKNQVVLKIFTKTDKLFDNDGKETGTIIAFRDVTDDIEREKALLLSERHMRALVETSHDLIWMSDLSGVITYINDASQRIYKLKPEEMIGRPFSDFIQSSMIENNNRNFLENIQKGKMNVELEGEIISRDGEVFFVKDNVVALLDEKGNLQGILGATKDITRKKKAEKELLESKERLELALAAGDLATWDFVLSNSLLIVNELYKDMLGLQFEGNTIPMDVFFQLIHPDDQNLIGESIQKALLFEEQKFNIEFRMKRSDGSYSWIHSMGKVVERDDQNKVVRLIGTNQDITVKKNLEIELQRWVKLYQSFIKYSGEGIYLFELDQPMSLDLEAEEQIRRFYHGGKIIISNDSFAKMYGYHHSSEIKGVDLFQLHGGDDKPENLLFLNKFIESNYRIVHEISKEIDTSGKTMYISNNAVGIIEDNALVRVWGSQLDITDQVEAHNELESAVLRYRLLFETNPVPLIIFDIDHFHFYDANKAAEELLEYEESELLKMTIRDIRPDVSEYSDAELSDRIFNQLSHNIEIRLKKKSGELIQVEIKSDQIDYGDNRAVLAAINDLTTLREAEKKVLQSLIEGEDNERRRVAKELHDSLGQSLTAACLNFDSIAKSLFLLDPARADQFKTGMTFLNLAIEESRNIAHNLMPKAIEDFGLVPSLKSLFNYVEKATGLDISFYENLSGYRLNKQTELNLYRITQEALNNVVKHAGASKIFVQIMLYQTEIIYTFEDNGKGFPMENLNTRQSGMGISSIYNRVLAMSGTFDIDSDSGGGTSITIQIPNM